MMAGLFEGVVTETCPCGAKWTGPSNGLEGKQERREWREAHRPCRAGAADSLAKGLPMTEAEIELTQDGARERVGRELLEQETINLVADVVGDLEDARTALTGVVGLLNLGPEPEGQPEAPPPQPPFQPRVTVVVSGVPLTVDIPTGAAVVADLVETALEQACVQRKGEPWDLRRENGSVLGSLSYVVAVINHGETLFLDPPAGGGGTA